MRRSSILILGLLVATVGPSAAADVRVSYLVEAKPLRRGVSADSTVTVAVHRDRDCTTPVTTQNVIGADLELIEKLRRQSVRGAPPAPETLRITLTLRDLAAPSPAYVVLSGTGITPVGGACQPADTLGPTPAPTPGPTVTAPPTATPSPTPTPGPTTPPPAGCATDAAELGPVCVDRFEASVWRVPASRPDVVQQIRDGSVTEAVLLAAGASQIQPASTQGCSFDEYDPYLTLEGEVLEPLYAVSIAGVQPSNCITARQATTACNLSGKRLLSSDEWTQAALGTPMPAQDDQATTCVLFSPAGPITTGSRSACVSQIGVHDMLGNLYEWTSIFDTPEDSEGRAWIIGAAFNVGTGFTGYPSHLSGPIAVHTDTGFRCAR